MAKGGSAIKGLAATVLSLQKQSGNVPAHVRASARKVLAGGGDANDIAALRNYARVKPGGASAINRGVRDIRGLAKTVSKYSVLAGTAAQGGVIGLGGGIGFVQQVGGDLNSLSRQKWFRDSLRATAQSYLGDANYGYGAALALGRTGRLAAAAGTLALAFGGGAVLGASLDGAFSGQTNLEQRRLANSNLDLSLGDATVMGSERDLAYARRKKVETYGQGLSTLPLIGELIGRLKFDEVTLAKLEAQVALQRSGIGSSGNILNQAQHRYFQNKYATESEATAAEWLSNKTGPSKETVEGTTAEAQRSIARADALSGQFYELAKQRRFALAEQYKKEANAEIQGAIPDKVNAAGWYQTAEAGRASQHNWAINQMPRAGPREH